MNEILKLLKELYEATEMRCTCFDGECESCDRHLKVKEYLEGLE